MEGEIRFEYSCDDKYNNDDICLYRIKRNVCYLRNIQSRRIKLTLSLITLKVFASILSFIR